MKFITYKQYMEYRYSNEFMQLREEEIVYKIETEENTYDEKQLKEIDKKHDKTFKNILGRKKEIIKFLNQFLKLKKEIKETQIIQCSTEFITRRYKNRHPDLLYRLKNKPVYFLIEHQSTVDKDMPLRILEYIGEIVRKDRGMLKNKKEIKYPIVVPIVIYTGCRRWNAEINFAHKQYHSREYRKFENNIEYNLIDVQNYTFDELLEKKSLFGSIMIMEKCRNQDELVEQIYKIIETIENPEDKEILSEIIYNIITPLVGKKISDEMLEKINEKEMITMSPLTKMILDLKIESQREGMKKGLQEGRQEGIQKGIQEGRQEGRQEGIKYTIMEIVKNMLRFGETEEKIIQYSGISKKELEEIKGMK